MRSPTLQPLLLARAAHWLAALTQVPVHLLVLFVGWVGLTDPWGFGKNDPEYMALLAAVCLPFGATGLAGCATLVAPTFVARGAAGTAWWIARAWWCFAISYTGFFCGTTVWLVFAVQMGL